MGLGDFYNFDHERVDFMTAMHLYADHERAQVALTDVEDTQVSTVFLFFDHNHRDNPQPVLYETMVFDSDGDVTWCERYSSREAALAGHDRAVAWVRSPVSPAPLTEPTTMSSTDVQ